MPQGFRNISFRPSSALTEEFRFRSLGADNTVAEAVVATESYSSAARRYLDGAFNEPELAGFNPPEQSARPELTELKVEPVPLTKSVVADYVQSHRGVPIYGSRVSVEMTDGRDLLGISGHLADPSAAPVAAISPQQALEQVGVIAGHLWARDSQGAPSLAYRFDNAQGTWRLVYIIKGVPVPDTEEYEADAHGHDDHGLLQYYTFFIDAHTGEEVARNPLRKNLVVAANGADADGTNHTFSATQLAANRFVLQDPVRKIYTHSMDFSDIECGPAELPGNDVESPSTTFNHPSAVVAHSNTTRVYDFYLNVLMRNGIDGAGGAIVSAVDCVAWRYNRNFGTCAPPDPNRKAWVNAAWVRVDLPQFPAVIRNGLMVYGQTMWQDGRFHSFAESLDVVGHELTHGVTDFTSNLEYRVETGALNESYSDIIGIAISNAHLPVASTWDWRLGEEVSSNGTPTRSLKEPTLFGQPDHMADFRRLIPPATPNANNDNGYVHGNSGIHNKAAYNLLQSPDFTWNEVVQLFYLTLTRSLTPVSTFLDSLDGILFWCESLFRNDANLAVRLNSVRDSFGRVGIAHSS